MAEKHLQHIRGLPCCVCFADPPNDPHHLLCVADTRGMALRAPDEYTVPLCRKCHDRLHREAHKRNEHQWFALQKVSWVIDLAVRLHKLTGDYEASMLILRSHNDRRKTNGQ